MYRFRCLMIDRLFLRQTRHLWLTIGSWKMISKRNFCFYCYCFDLQMKPLRSNPNRPHYFQNPNCLARNSYLAPCSSWSYFLLACLRYCFFVCRLIVLDRLASCLEGSCFVLLTLTSSLRLPMNLACSLIGFSAVYPLICWPVCFLLVR